MFAASFVAEPAGKLGDGKKNIAKALMERRSHSKSDPFRVTTVRKRA